MKTKLTEEEIDKRVKEWSQSKDPRSLREYLGMTRKEYEAFVKGEFGKICQPK